MSNTGLSTSRIPYIAACGGKCYNPVLGCSNDGTICAVRARGLCWAEGINKHETFEPRFNAECLEAPLRARKPTTIFTGFRSDLWSDKVDPAWRKQLFEVERQCPQHTFVHLTKCPRNMERWDAYDGNYKNLWFGVSVCNMNDGMHPHHLFMKTPLGSHKWISFEPITDSIGDYPSWLFKSCGTEFVVIGGLSSGAGKIIPPEEGGTKASWVAPIIEAACEAKIPVWLKNLSKAVLNQITNPLTGKRFESMSEMRQLPESWMK